MFNALCSIKDRVQSFIQDQKGVVAWEYLLVIAGVSVAIIVAIAFAAPSLIQAVINGTCSALDTVMTMPSCTFSVS